LLLVNAADVQDAIFVYKTVPVLDNPPKYTRAQLDALNEELKPKLDFQLSENGISQRNAVQIIHT
jgi:hypothetical protein